MGVDCCMLFMGMCGVVVMIGGSFLVGILGLVLGSIFLFMLLVFLNKAFFGFLVVLVYIGGMLLLFAFVASMLGLWKGNKMSNLWVELFLGFFLLWFMKEQILMEGGGVENMVFSIYLDGFFYSLLGGFLLVLVLLMLLYLCMGSSVKL
uniref:NADH dehydrogenase subunit 6 n=1 Tax=Halocynthia papillosa TaxID=201963 RepID=A0A1L7PQL2_HALPP|nr:NADH dehydrogenase subunit 6 [Halocynthia papillosa]